MSGTTRTFSIIVSLAVLFTIGNIAAAFASSKDESVSNLDNKIAKANNAERVKKIIHKNKGKRGEDFAGESTAGVGGGVKSGIQADTSEDFKKVNQKEKDAKIYKDSTETTSP